MRQPLASLEWGGSIDQSEPGGTAVKVYLLLVNDEQFFFYSDESEADQSRVEAPARGGWGGWLEGRWHRFQKSWHESDAGVARWARRSWDWLHSMTHPDETML